MPYPSSSRPCCRSAVHLLARLEIYDGGLGGVQYAAVSFRDDEKGDEEEDPNRVRSGQRGGRRKKRADPRLSLHLSITRPMLCCTDSILYSHRPSVRSQYHPIQHDTIRLHSERPLALFLKQRSPRLRILLSNFSLSSIRMTTHYYAITPHYSTLLWQSTNTNQTSMGGRRVGRLGRRCRCRCPSRCSSRCSNRRQRRVSRERAGP
jgi:hypothetical protein